MEKFTITQRERLTELDAASEVLEREFDTKEERNAEFKKIETQMAREGRQRLKELVEERHITFTEEVSRRLQDWLMKRRIYEGKHADNHHPPNARKDDH